ncbi:MAG: hypothetical protein K1X61_08990 [Chitinophagales bacterium]|nr:hypothetical protein [Chitinophagales bacterium]
MKSNRAAWIIAVIAFCILIAFVLYRFRDAKQVNWYAMYRENGEQPYDVSVIAQLLQHYFPAYTFTAMHQSAAATLPLTDTAKSSYIFIGAQLYLAENDISRLRDFVFRGNDAFIAAEILPGELLDSIIHLEEFSGGRLPYLTDSFIHINFSHHSLFKQDGFRFGYVFEWKSAMNNWNYFPDSLMQESGDAYVSLATVNDSFLNYIKVPYGAGNFYLHSTPICFCNYYLLQPEALEHAQKVFSHLAASNIYWDEFSKVPQTAPGNRAGTDTPLHYILSQTGLRWAWYVLLSMAALFLLFRARRDQRIIPIAEQRSNTSLEFIQTIGSLYLQQQDHRALALQKMKLFLAFIRQRYAIQTKNMDADFVMKLAEKSQVQSAKIRQLTEDYTTIENMHAISKEQLYTFHAALADFYQACK